MNVDKLVRMANQIAGFFAHEGRDKAPASIADHIYKFWDPRMRKEIIEAVTAARVKNLDPLALVAVQRLAAEATAAPAASSAAAKSAPAPVAKLASYNPATGECGTTGVGRTQWYRACAGAAARLRHFA